MKEHSVQIPIKLLKPIEDYQLILYLSSRVTTRKDNKQTKQNNIILG